MVLTKGTNVISSVLMENEELKHDKAIKHGGVGLSMGMSLRNNGARAWLHGLHRMAPSQVAAGQQKGHGQLNCWGHSATCQVRDASPMVSIGT